MTHVCDVTLILFSLDLTLLVRRRGRLQVFAFLCTAKNAQFLCVCVCSLNLELVLGLEEIMQLLSVDCLNH